jgi:dienelactone hydrolase
MDFGGRGDSFGDPEKTTIASMTEEAKAALAWMRGRSGGGAHVPTVIVAICSGCKVAIGAAAEVEGLRGLCLWSPEPMGALRPRSTNRRKTLAMLRVYARKLLRPETWRKIFGGRVRGAMVGKALMRHETRGDDEARREDDVLAKFQAYDGEILAVFGSGDPEAAGSEKVYAEYCRRYDISLERHVIVRAGHSFYRAEWADELLGMTLEWIKRLAGAENQDKAEDSGRGE